MYDSRSIPSYIECIILLYTRYYLNVYTYIKIDSLRHSHTVSLGRRDKEHFFAKTKGGESVLNILLYHVTYLLFKESLYISCCILAMVFLLLPLGAWGRPRSLGWAARTAMGHRRCRGAWGRPQRGLGRPGGGASVKSPS